MKRILSCAALALAVIGCGGGGDDDDEQSGTGAELVGVYQTTSTTLAEPCDGAAMPADNYPVYFRIASEQTGGAASLAVYPCLVPEASNCNPANPYPSFDGATAIGGGVFRSEAWGLTPSSSMPNACPADYSLSDIKKTTGGVTITTSNRSGSLMGAALCDVSSGVWSEQQIAAIKALPCTSREVASAERL